MARSDRDNHKKRKSNPEDKKRIAICRIAQGRIVPGGN